MFNYVLWTEPVFHKHPTQKVKVKWPIQVNTPTKGVSDPESNSRSGLGLTFAPHLRYGNRISDRSSDHLFCLTNTDLMPGTDRCNINLVSPPPVIRDKIGNLFRGGAAWASQHPTGESHEAPRGCGERPRLVLAVLDDLVVLSHRSKTTLYTMRPLRVDGAPSRQGPIRRGSRHMRPTTFKDGVKGKIWSVDSTVSWATSAYIRGICTEKKARGAGLG
jgi:hypothetical protein